MVVQFAPTAACVMFTKLQPVMLKIAVPPFCKRVNRVTSTRTREHCLQAGYYVGVDVDTARSSR